MNMQDQLQILRTGYVPPFTKKAFFKQFWESPEFEKIRVMAANQPELAESIRLQKGVMSKLMPMMELYSNIMKRRQMQALTQRLGKGALVGSALLGGMSLPFLLKKRPELQYQYPYYLNQGA